MKKSILLLMLLVVFSTRAFSQNWQEYNRQTITLFNQGDYQQAAIYGEKALKLAEKSLGKDDFNYGTLLNNLANIYERMGQYDKAIYFATEALDNAEKNLGKDHPDYGMLLNNLAELYRVMGHYAEALPLYLEALENTEKAWGKSHPDYGICLNNLAILYKSMGEYERALPLALEALENVEKALGKDNFKNSFILNNLAGIYVSLGHYNKALPLYLEAVEITEKFFGKDRSYYGVSLNNLAGLYKTMGQYDKALTLYVKALEITEQTLGKDHYAYGTRLNNLARLYKIMGHYDIALPLLVEALENTEQALGKDHYHYGNRLNNLAQLYQRMGQYDKALSLFVEALEYTEKALAKDHTSYGKSLNNLASMYRSLGQHDKALSLYLEALENIEKTLGKDHFYYGILIDNQAGIYESMGHYKKALTLYLKAIENTEKALGKDHFEYGSRLNNLAGLYQRMGQYDKALPIYLEALGNIQKSLGEEHLTYGICLGNLALLYEINDQYDNALSHHLEALENIYLQLEQAFSFMSESEKEQFVNTVNFNFKGYQSFFTRYSTEKPEVAGHAFDVELATKGMILHSGIQVRETIMNSGDSSAIAIYEEWLMLRNILARQYSMPLANRRSDLHEVESKSERLEAELSRLSSDFREATALFDTRWQDIQSALEPGEIAIEFASFDYRSNQGWTDSTLYIAIVLGKDDLHPQLVPLFEQRQLDEILDREKSSDEGFVTNLYRGFERLTGPEPSAGYGKQLYELIWEPLEEYVPEGSTVYFSPSGSLHQIAFAAIPVGEDTLLMDRYQLRQLSTTAMLTREVNATNITATGIALFGGINYDSDEEELLAAVADVNAHRGFSRSIPDDIDRGNENWTYLPGTLREVEQIVTLTADYGLNTQLFSGVEALEEQIKALAGPESPYVLHIATHGFFFPDPIREQRESLHLMGEDLHVFRASDNPLQRSGLLFAGANRAWSGEAVPDGFDDGILTAYEVSNLYFGNTRLVILSACETGLGDINGSEGVFGLQRAFKQAGAEYLLMSLWKVPDNATAEFMVYFYEKWLSGETIPDAFKATQEYMKQQYPNDPYSWAAFVLVR